MTRPKVIYTAFVVITVREPGGDMPGFLDMLRYDGAIVGTWSRVRETASSSTFRVGLMREDQPFTIDRWHSFGLLLHVMSEESR